MRVYVRFSLSFLVDMVHYCCVFDCKNNSTVRDFSFHSFPKDKNLIKVRNSLFVVMESNDHFVRLRVKRVLSFFLFPVVVLRFGFHEYEEILRKILG